MRQVNNLPRKLGKSQGKSADMVDEKLRWLSQSSQSRMSGRGHVGFAVSTRIIRPITRPDRAQGDALRLFCIRVYSSDAKVATCLRVLFPRQSRRSSLLPLRSPLNLQRLGRHLNAVDCRKVRVIGAEHVDCNAVEITTVSVCLNGSAAADVDPV